VGRPRSRSSTAQLALCWSPPPLDRRWDGLLALHLTAKMNTAVVQLDVVGAVPGQRPSTRCRSWRDRPRLRQAGPSFAETGEQLGQSMTTGMAARPGRGPANETTLWPPCTAPECPTPTSRSGWDFPTFAPRTGGCPGGLAEPAREEATPRGLGQAEYAWRLGEPVRAAVAAAGLGERMYRRVDRGRAELSSAGS
jgi:hypothetical protein